MSPFSPLATCVAEAFALCGHPTTVALAPPTTPGAGHLSTALALRLAPKGQARALAQAVAGHLMAHLHPWLDKAEAAGPGFLNLWLTPVAFWAFAQEAIDQGPHYGQQPLHGPALVLEYVSANPTGPLHVGHTRGAVVGDSLARLLTFTGTPVVREYYTNDAGAQIEALAQSVLARWHQASGTPAPLPQNGYPGAYLQPVGEHLAATQGPPEAHGPHALPLARAAGLLACHTRIGADLATLGVAFDRHVSEQAVQQTHLAKALACLQDAGLLYTAIPPGPVDGAASTQPCLLFASTTLGDSADRVVQKADGTWTYFAGDLAHFQAALDRGERAFHLVLGADHGGYADRLQAGLTALSGGTAHLSTTTVGLVSLLEQGQPVAMSKRAGRFETLADLVADLGADCVRMAMLSRAAHTPFACDLAQMRQARSDNPAFYAQYAAARLASALAGAPQGDADTTHAPLCAADLALLLCVASWPHRVEKAASAKDPHLVAVYVAELAQAIHALWAQGNADPAWRLTASPARARIAQAARSTLAAALAILGVEAVERLDWA